MSYHSYKLRQAYQSLQTEPADIILATIIETMGSTYQKAGARMLIAENGELTGLLGGGCFEVDLLEQARSVFEDGQAKMVFYDMRSPDDAIWGLGLGCNGAVRILLQLLSAAHDFYPLNIIANIKSDDDIGVLATVCDSVVADHPPGHSTFLPVARHGDTYNIRSEESIYSVPARQMLLNDRSCVIEQAIGADKISVFYDLLQAPIHLLLIGAGVDAVPVTQIAKLLGWYITVVDYRDAYIKPDRFPEVEQLLLIVADELEVKLPLDRFDAMVLMTHNIDYDERYLAVIAASNIPYIGLLGPAKRRDRLLESLGTSVEKVTGRVYGPVGLDIGADTPEGIALSIVAEVQAVLAHRSGAQLYKRDMPLHDREVSQGQGDG